MLLTSCSPFHATSRHHPGYRLLFHPFGILSNVLPRARGMGLGSQYVFTDKHEGQIHHLKLGFGRCADEQYLSLPAGGMGCNSHGNYPGVSCCKFPFIKRIRILGQHAPDA